MNRKNEEYFKYLCNRAECHSKQAELYLDIRSYQVKLIFLGIEPSEIMMMNLSYLMADTDTENAATEKESGAVGESETVYIWEDSLSDLVDQSVIPESQRFIHYHQTDEYNILFPGVTKRFAARFNEKKTTFVCFERGKVYPESYINKPFVNEIQWWVMDKYFVLHGAAVGIDGKGALITAPSGRGKSTLALAGLLEGMDYIAEDYVLVNRNGSAYAYPVFTTGYILPDTLEMFHELKCCELLYVKSRNKHLVDLSGYRNQFKKELRICAMIYPNITDMSASHIVKPPSVKPFMEALTTSAKQIKTCGKYADSFMMLFNRMKTIPSYQFDMTRDPRKNARGLKHFLRAIDD